MLGSWKPLCRQFGEPQASNSLLIPRKTSKVSPRPPQGRNAKAKLVLLISFCHPPAWACPPRGVWSVATSSGSKSKDCISITSIKRYTATAGNGYSKKNLKETRCKWGIRCVSNDAQMLSQKPSSKHGRCDPYGTIFTQPLPPLQAYPFSPASTSLEKNRLAFIPHSFLL